MNAQPDEIVGNVEHRYRVHERRVGTRRSSRPWVEVFAVDDVAKLGQATIYLGDSEGADCLRCSAPHRSASLHLIEVHLEEHGVATGLVGAVQALFTMPGWWLTSSTLSANSPGGLALAQKLMGTRTPLHDAGCRHWSCHCPALLEQDDLVERLKREDPSRRLPVDEVKAAPERAAAVRQVTEPISQLAAEDRRLA